MKHTDATRPTQTHMPQIGDPADAHSYRLAYIHMHTHTYIYIKIYYCILLYIILYIIVYIHIHIIYASQKHGDTHINIHMSEIVSHNLAFAIQGWT